MARGAISAFALSVPCRYPLFPTSPSAHDIWATANEAIKSHDDPLLRVALRYDALLKEGRHGRLPGVAADCEDSRRGRSETFFDVRCLWASWLGFMDTYRTMCMAPDQAFRLILGELEELRRAG